MVLSQLSHFFEHYKGPGSRQVGQVDGMGRRRGGQKEILDGIARYEAAATKPMF
ncbi:MAG: hypothetical protein M5R42_16210 [Rhodocyclaceae bacterium]|nr:hypothetical protein [Rhodocyclaceae bacterium]